MLDLGKSFVSPRLIPLSSLNNNIIYAAVNAETSELISRQHESSYLPFDKVIVQ